MEPRNLQSFSMKVIKKLFISLSEGLKYQLKSSPSMRLVEVGITKPWHHIDPGFIQEFNFLRDRRV